MGDGAAATSDPVDSTSAFERYRQVRVQAGESASRSLEASAIGLSLMIALVADTPGGGRLETNGHSALPRVAFVAQFSEVDHR